MGDPILRELPDDAPVLILMSGIAGGSHDKYLVRLGCCTFMHSCIRAFVHSCIRAFVYSFEVRSGFIEDVCCIHTWLVLLHSSVIGGERCETDERIKGGV